MTRGRPRTGRTPQLEEAIIHAVEEDTSVNTRQLALTRMIAVIWPNFLLLLSITLYSTICAADPFLSAGTPNVDVAYDGKDTTITIYENNEENIKIAIINCEYSLTMFGSHFFISDTIKE
ncbi:hypothetical protein C0J52_23139 [Blattella germanica]|nr:hypothetical protein C0J52_23139 [Blattella germanica]